MHILIGAALLALVVGYLLGRRARQRQKSPAIDQTAQSPFERQIRASQFESLVIENSRRVPVLVDFYADWCGPCHAFSPILSDMAKKCDGAFLLAKIDFDKNQELAARLGIDALPGIALFKDGEQVDGFSGGKLPHSLRYFLAKNGVAIPEDV